MLPHSWICLCNVLQRTNLFGPLRLLRKLARNLPPRRRQHPSGSRRPSQRRPPRRRRSSLPRRKRRPRRKRSRRPTPRKLLLQRLNRRKKYAALRVCMLPASLRIQYCDVRSWCCIMPLAIARLKRRVNLEQSLSLHFKASWPARTDSSSCGMLHSRSIFMFASACYIFPFAFSLCRLSVTICVIGLSGFCNGCDWDLYNLFFSCRINTSSSLVKNVDYNSLLKFCC